MDILTFILIIVAATIATLALAILVIAVVAFWDFVESSKERRRIEQIRQKFSDVPFGSVMEETSGVQWCFMRSEENGMFVKRLMNEANYLRPDLILVVWLDAEKRGFVVKKRGNHIPTHTRNES